jgi:hypothetical protein
MYGSVFGRGITKYTACIYIHTGLANPKYVKSLILKNVYAGFESSGRWIMTHPSFLWELKVCAIPMDRAIQQEKEEIRPRCALAQQWALQSSYQCKNNRG